MTADRKLMEAFLRLEHKVDLLLKKDKTNEEIIKVGDPRHVCPVCKQPVEYTIDIEDSVVVRKCGCSTGKIALDLKAFAPPALPAKRTDNGRDDEQEDRNDSPRGRRGPGGR
jgi:hypothetical protein